MHLHRKIPALGKRRTGDPRGLLAGPPCLLGELYAREKSCLKNRQNGPFQDTHWLGSGGRGSGIQDDLTQYRTRYKRYKRPCVKTTEKPKGVNIT